MTASASLIRAHTVRRGRWLTWATLGYNSLEGLLSVGAGLLAGSVALVGFGVDSFIEVIASVAAIWRLRADAEPLRRARVEAHALRIIGLCFLALAAYVIVDAARSIVLRKTPEESPLGIVIAAVSLVGMPLLARAQV